jgi:protein-S-isoprenylcysteine O-methyltransferase Ste14
MTIYQQIVAACWGVLLVVWFVLALALGQRGRHTTRAWWLRLAVIALLLVAVYFITRARPPPALGQPTQGLALAGAVLCVAGSALAIWARMSLGARWGVRPSEHDPPEIVTTGPFAYVRHPLYAGIIAMLIGSAINNPAAYVDILLGVVSLAILARHEERDMLRLLPDAYGAYRQRTKRFVPFVF